MQKQKINYLTLQSTYDQIEVALFSNQKKVALIQLSKFTASAELVPAIKHCLDVHSLNFNTLDFICTNLGPAPFTSLRTTIVTVNGIGYAAKVPLVGVNGLEIFASTTLSDTKNLVIILNAYSKSVYYAIRNNQNVIYGWQMFDQFILDLQDKFSNQDVLIIGQGVAVFNNELSCLPANFAINQNHPGYPNIELIAQAGLDLYQNKHTSFELAPLYLKQAEPLK